MSIDDEKIEKGHMDFITDLAYPLPIRIIAELLGIPSEDHHLYKKWASSQQLINNISTTTNQDGRKCRNK